MVVCGKEENARDREYSLFSNEDLPPIIVFSLTTEQGL